MDAAKRQKTAESAPRLAGATTAPTSERVAMASVVENVAGDSDFPSLTQWLMANTKDKEARGTPVPPAQLRPPAPRPLRVAARARSTPPAGAPRRARARRLWLTVRPRPLAPARSSRC
jgi:hypothetical protein